MSTDAAPEQVHIAGLYRYPVKGLTPEALQRVQLTPDETLPFDRASPSRSEPTLSIPKIRPICARTVS